jgi:hypothetical protein
MTFPSTGSLYRFGRAGEGRSNAVRIERREGANRVRISGNRALGVLIAGPKYGLAEFLSSKVVKALLRPV